MPSAAAVRGNPLEPVHATLYPKLMTKRSPFRYFKTSPEIIRLAVMMYVRFALSLRNVEDLLHERGIEISHETVRFWWQRFGPMFTAELLKRRVGTMKSSMWRWHLDEVFVKITVKPTTFGGPLTRKVKCRNRLSPRRGTRRQPSVSLRNQ